MREKSEVGNQYTDLMNVTSVNLKHIYEGSTTALLNKYTYFKVKYTLV